MSKSPAPARRLGCAIPSTPGCAASPMGARTARTLLMIRIGWGYDIHRLYPGHPTVLGGVEFPDFPRGFDTHSDGDVVAHAIIDALAGALGAGSLGDYFPEDDPADQDARSIEFLTRFRPVMARGRARVVNLDCTNFCSAPRIAPGG